MTRAIDAAQRNWGARLREYTWHGMRLVVLENELLRVGVLAGRGADIVELNYKPRDLDFVWLSPHGVREPSGPAGPYRDGLATFVESYPGGWQEIFPNGGAPSHYGGAAFGQHDEVFALAWDIDVVEDSEASVAVRFRATARKVPCLLERTVRMDAGVPGFRFEERLTNTSAVPVRAMWGHHITFGRPFLRPGGRIRLPNGVTVIPHDVPIAPDGRRVHNREPFPWPVARDADGNGLDLSIVPEPGTPSDIVYLTDFPADRAWYEVHDADGRVGGRVEWDARQMPYLWCWQEFGATTAYPWYGRTWTIGLEPFSSYPTNGLADAVANGTALTLEGGESREFWLGMTVIDSEE